MRAPYRAVTWLLLGGLALSTESFAQTFPSEGSWVALPCSRTEAMTDPLGDVPAALRERDLVGDARRPAGSRSATDATLFLRMRLDEDPIPQGTPKPAAWGFLFDVDRDPRTYEVQVLVNGRDKEVTLARNSTTTLTNDPADPADAPVKTYPLADFARSISGSGGGFGSGPDFELEVAIPWADLEPLGVTATTSVEVWAATSSTGIVLDGDLACADGAGGGRLLSAGPQVRTVLDPRADTDHDGFTDALEVQSGTDPAQASSHPSGAPDAGSLAGGGGCSSTGLDLTLEATGLTALLLGRRKRRG